jgi:hypothetical protein
MPRMFLQDRIEDLRIYLLTAILLIWRVFQRARNFGTIKKMH